VPTTSLTNRPFGSWTSPISIDSAIKGGVKYSELRSDGGIVSWSESRPEEAGRSTVMQWIDGEAIELTPAPFNVRSRVHEYGGGSWASANGVTIFSNLPDNRLYRIDHGSAPRPITPESAWRFADLQLDPSTNRLYAVREDHSVEDTEAVNTIVVLDLSGPNDDGGKIIVSGTDFVSSLTFDSSGERIAWLSWNHPNMPWDGCDLFAANIDDNTTLTHIRHVAGGVEESIGQPRFLPDGRLCFISDRSGWGNLYVAADESITPLAPKSAEFGFPQWNFGRSYWDIVNEQTIVTVWHSNGIASMGTLDLASGTLTEIDQPFTVIRSIRAIPGEKAAVAIVASPTHPTQLVRFDLTDGSFTTLRGGQLDIDRAECSIAESISWPTPDGASAYGFFYSPTNTQFEGVEGELPPLIVESHGGPTGSTEQGFSHERQFWTNRGFAILDVNYGGSTGYGREYRERLNGNWGIVDVEDCIAGVHALIERGLVDPERVIIRGGSAGGYTTLVALTNSNVFRIGTSYYGVGDLEALATDTHKFESRYLDNLVGPHPERKDLYVERSPIHHTERLSAAMLLLQGLDDKVVPPNQSSSMAEAVRAKELPVALIEFAGEGHGFRGEYAQRRSLEAELSFYSQILGFPLADEIEPIAIENL
jgi:dipeptidyl aminopeptidase/acylaminoacyl peptidase